MRQQGAALAPRHGLRKDFRKNRALYAMILPGLVLLIVFKYFPMYGLIAAFQDYNPCYYIRAPRPRQPVAARDNSLPKLYNGKAKV